MEKRSTKQMRMLFFINGLYSGGKERRLIELMKEIRIRTDFIFELVVMHPQIHYPEVADMGIRIHFIIRKTKKDLSVFQKLYTICKNFKPDLIHCWDSMTAVYSIPVCKLLKIKLVNGMIVDAPSRRNIFNKNWLRAKLTFPFSNIIIANSRAGLQAYSAPAGKSRYIHNGFNFKRTEHLTGPREILQQIGISTPYIIGMVATFSEFKDYKTYFRAAEMILQERKDVTFLAIGNHTDSADAKKLITPGYMEYFRLLGKRNQIESFINIMDIGVLATFTEGISNSILEYMALAKPVIATSGGGTNEIVADHQTGLLVPPNDPVILAEKMNLLLNSEPLRRNFGAEGQKRVHENFSIESMTNGYIYYYQSINALKKNQNI